jgi:hypothetical protein
MNVLFIDKKRKEIERFEPNGTIFYQDKNCPNNLVDEELQKYFQNFWVGSSSTKYKYISPKEFCPYMGPQTIERLDAEEFGFCITWSFLYANERLSHPDRKVAAKELQKTIIEAAKKSIQEGGLDDYEYVMKYFQKKIRVILKEMEPELQKINETFGTNLKLDNRTLIIK